jgi:hypothetical protein
MGVPSQTIDAETKVRNKISTNGSGGVERKLKTASLIMEDESCSIRRF